MDQRPAPAPRRWRPRWERSHRPRIGRRRTQSRHPHAQRQGSGCERQPGAPAGRPTRIRTSPRTACLP
eukprot:14371126-Heterocapsa_arctica.AAC.1